VRKDRIVWETKIQMEHTTYTQFSRNTTSYKCKFLKLSRDVNILLTHQSDRERERERERENERI
jgi:hypothetical protein